MNIKLIKLLLTTECHYQQKLKCYQRNILIGLLECGEADEDK